MGIIFVLPIECFIHLYPDSKAHIMFSYLKQRFYPENQSVDHNNYQTMHFTSNMILEFAVQTVCGYVSIMIAVF